LFLQLDDPEKTLPNDGFVKSFRYTASKN